ncbi:MAG: NAD(P)/FAD-dependent oxidoreductase [Caldimonas sp.]
MRSDALVIGAGPAGLASAACLRQRGLQVQLIERGAQLAASWRAHYDRLHLHTVKTESALPGLPFPAAAPRYVSRAGVVDYLAAYAVHHGLAPQVGEEALAIVPAAGGWQTSTASGRVLRARTVVVATGANRWPNRPSFAGEAGFRGRILHSGDYRNALPFARQRVLVVGMGNTGAEIALDLVEHGIGVAISVRAPLNIVHRDVLGRPTQLTSIALARLPHAWGDAAARVLRDLTVGDLSRYGLKTSPLSPLRQLREHGKTPVIDVGTLARIKSREIAVHPGIDRYTAHGVRFVDGTDAPFDAVILATGYAAGIEKLFPGTELALDRNGMPVGIVGRGPLQGIYFVGFDIRQPGGLLRTIAQQAQQVADEIVAATQTAPR